MALIRVETERVLFTLAPARPAALPTPEGSLVARTRRPGAALRTSWTGERGPGLWEQTAYALYAHARGGLAVRVEHRDPVVLRDVLYEEGGTVAHGQVDFGSHPGLSDFTVLAGGSPEFDLRVEVFPSKIDYARDYEALRDEVQDTLAGLALEYLRPTHGPARAAPAARKTAVEWATILRQSCDELERALREVARAPSRGLSRAPTLARAEAVKRADAAVRAAVRTGAGTGASLELPSGLAVREKLREARARATLDTPEHRWLAAAVRAARRDASRLREREAQREGGARRERALAELAALEARLSALLALEPLAGCAEPPTPGFSSQRLQSAPGYREAYRACLLLGLGLRADGGPMNASLKDVGTLYEYFCYLTALRMLADESGLALPVASLFTVRESGLSVNLERGRETRVRFDLSPGRAVSVSYNPTLSGELLPAAQQPDILVRLEQEGWDPAYVVLDAKYRLDASPGYRERFGAEGPPVDALNALHRYRDAIVERDGAAGGRPARVVVAAAALYPARATEDYRAGALWQSLERVGVGAIPLLPGAAGPLREWLRAVLARGAWGLADRALPHRAVERARRWHEAANEQVLLVSAGARGAREYLAGCRARGGVVLPLGDAGDAGGALQARWVALFAPRARAVGHVARVDGVRVEAGGAEVVLRTGPWMALQHPLAAERGGAGKLCWPGFSSRLALDRARTLEELLLASEPEWRLFESLVAVGAAFSLALDAPDAVEQAAGRVGRVWFVGAAKGARVRHAGDGVFERVAEAGVIALDEAVAALAARR